MTSAPLWRVDDLRGRAVAILLDVAPDSNTGISAESVKTVQFCIDQGAATIDLIPSRAECFAATEAEAETMSQRVYRELALSKGYPDMQDRDLSRCLRVTCREQDVYGFIAPSLARHGGRLINDTFAGHPLATTLRDGFGITELAGFACAASFDAVWPLSNKTVVVLTDVDAHEQPKHCDLVVATVQHLASTAARAKAVVLACTTRATAEYVAAALEVGLDTELPTTRFAPAWSRPVSVVLTDYDQTVAFRKCCSPASLHVFVNETVLPRNPLAAIAVDALSHQACGYLRQAMMVVGLSVGHAELHAGQAALQRVWPIKNKRFTFLCDPAAVMMVPPSTPSSAVSLPQLLTHNAVNRIVAAGGIVVLVPHSATAVAAAGADAAAADAEHQEQLQRIAEELQRRIPAATSVVFGGGANGYFSAEWPQRPPQRGTVLFLDAPPVARRPSADSRAVEHDELLANFCDVFVRDMSLFGGFPSEQADAFLERARAAMRHVAVGDSAQVLNRDLRPSTAIGLSNAEARGGAGGLLPTHLSMKNFIEAGRTVIGAGSGGGAAASSPLSSSSAAAARLATSPTAAMAAYEAQEMRKPVSQGEGSLWSNVASSVATCVLLHPLQLYAAPHVPDPRALTAALPGVVSSVLPAALSSSYLTLRVVHAVARDVLFHYLTKRTLLVPVRHGAGGHFSDRGRALPGWLGAMVAGVASDPLRAVSLGVPARNALQTALLDPRTVATTAIMNVAPQVSFHLRTIIWRLLRTNLKVSSASTALAVVSGTLSRALVCLLLYKVVLMRRYGMSAGGAGATRGEGVLLVSYIVKEILAWVIERFVQRHFH